jgi:RimJ/RimL family protein N-acetyltransferase
MTAAEPLVGARVLLRPFRPGDVPAVLAYASDPEVTRHLAWDAYDDPDTAAAFIRSTLGGGDAWIARAVVLRATDAVIGGVDLRVVSPLDGRAELGYGLARAHWGRGYAHEAAGLLVAFGFARLGLRRIEAYCAVENVRSARTLEALGFRREARVAVDRGGTGVPHDHWRYAREPRTGDPSPEAPPDGHRGTPA